MQQAHRETSLNVPVPQRPSALPLVVGVLSAIAALAALLYHVVVSVLAAILVDEFPQPTVGIAKSLDLDSYYVMLVWSAGVFVIALVIAVVLLRRAVRYRHAPRLCH